MYDKTIENKKMHKKPVFFVWKIRFFVENRKVDTTLYLRIDI